MVQHSSQSSQHVSKQSKNATFNHVQYSLYNWSTRLYQIVWTQKKYIDQVRKYMRSTKQLDKEDTDYASIINTSEVTNLEFVGV